jgi:hypothetical protein
MYKLLALRFNRQGQRFGSWYFRKSSGEYKSDTDFVPAATLKEDEDSDGLVSESGFNSDDDHTDSKGEIPVR